MGLPAAVADALEGGMPAEAPVEGPAVAPAAVGAAAEVGFDGGAKLPVSVLAGPSDGGATGSPWTLMGTGSEAGVAELADWFRPNVR